MAHDITGDPRDELIVWDIDAIWIYTQDRPFEGEKIYQPERQPLYNESNYATAYSRSGWKK
jgi:rhamnogalacturonan endolyase